MNKYVISVAILATALLSGWLVFSDGQQTANATVVTVYKSPTCGCCKEWIKHMQANGFSVKTVDVNNVNPYKLENGISFTLASCHTALVDGYAVEGHVPATDIKRMLKERPAIRGLAVPGMPAGSPGMEQGNKDHYNVFSFDKAGAISVYASY